KLCMGFRTGIAPDSPRYPALLVFNSIFGDGGSLHSKLFTNIREKEALAYYIYSKLDRFNGLMLVSGGIDHKNRDKTVAMVQEQLQAVCRGEVSDYEISATRDRLDSSLEMVSDSPLSMVGFDLNKRLSGLDMDIEELRLKVRRVTLEEVQEVARGIRLDLVYFLCSK
ncbi:MAG TPA: hypothetical protein DD727_00470, partial [Clostridiales bacterium]|nr:hypothetical protein [Clostridiales bacterium]